MGIADRHQHVAGTSIHLIERELRGWQQLEHVKPLGVRGRFQTGASKSEQEDETAHERERRQRRWIADKYGDQGCSGEEQAWTEEP